MYDEIDINSIALNTPPPEEEPKRQYYYIAKCRQLVEAFTARTGRRPTACTHTFGCQMNARDSEKLRGILLEAGYEESEDERADLVIYNTCTVRENANNKVYGRLGTLQGYKKKNPYMKIALCGCMMQEPQVVEKLKESYSFVDLIFGTHNIYRFPELLYRCLTREGKDGIAGPETGKKKNAMVVEIWEDGDRIVERLPMERKYRFKSGVNIMFGCDNFCSYCIVPYVRGRERSRRPTEILREIEALIDDGVTEVMLLGQNVNSYGKKLDEQVTFAELLRAVDKLPGLDRVRFMTSHPKDLSDELIAAMRDCKKVCHHLHLPLQSGSSRLLARMNRHYDKEQYLCLVEKLRAAVPDIALTTDIIVGFPGETEEDFLETMDVVERVRFDSAFTFIYSKRTGTPAAKMEDQVPEAVVKERFDRLLARVQAIGAEKAKALEGKILPVLAEEINSHSGGPEQCPLPIEEGKILLNGRLDNNAVVHFYGDAKMIGQLLPVRLDRCMGFYYYGSLAGQGEQTDAS